jgi:hypothetical protein
MGKPSKEAETTVSDEHRPGYYKDRDGNWQRDRRKTTERRAGGGSAFTHHDRRTLKRRKADLEFLERETKMQIEDALEEFVTDRDSQDSEPGA